MMRGNNIDLAVCTSHRLNKATGKQLRTNAHTDCVNENTNSRLLRNGTLEIQPALFCYKQAGLKATAANVSFGFLVKDGLLWEGQC